MLNRSNRECANRPSRAGSVTRRQVIQRAGMLGAALALEQLAPAYARADARHSTTRAADGQTPGEQLIDLAIDAFPIRVNSRTGRAIAVNGSVPGPLVRLREGDTAVIRVTNRLDEVSSIHWHGILLPPDMDGVPGVSFPGIRPGETFTYRFPVTQSGTYWAHSHSGGQELLGLYFPLIIDPVAPEPFDYDRDYVVMLSDWSFESPEAIIGHLKKQAGYYNFQKRTMADLVRDVGANGLGPAAREHATHAKQPGPDGPHGSLLRHSSFVARKRAMMAEVASHWRVSRSICRRPALVNR